MPKEESKDHAEAAEEVGRRLHHEPGKEQRHDRGGNGRERGIPGNRCRNQPGDDEAKAEQPVSCGNHAQESRHPFSALELEIEGKNMAEEGA